MIRKIFTLFLAFILAFCVTACGGSDKPDIDVDQIAGWIQDTGFMDSYDYVTDWAVALDDSGTVTINVVVKDGTDPELALQVADDLVRQVSSAACNQSDELTGPSKDNYGSFYDSYPAMVGVAEQSKTSNTKDWLVFHSIAAGSGPMVTLQK